MPDIIPQPFDPERFARQAVEDSIMTDYQLDQISDRITALEEIMAARWPARIAARRRLRRAIRQSAAPFASMGPEFADRRGEALSVAWLLTPRITAAQLAARPGGSR